MKTLVRDAIIATGAVFTGAVVYALARGSTQAAGGSKPPGSAQPPGTRPPAIHTHWLRVETLQPGKRTRLSFPGYLLAPVLAATGSGAQIVMLQRWFGGVAAVFGAALGPAGRNVQFWGPNDALPADWPADDPNSDGYRIEYATNLQTAPLVVSALPPGGVAGWQYV